MIPYDSNVLWIVVVGFIIAFVLAFGIGANDVANSFGTSVGAKVLTLKQACVVASIFEIAGAVLIGARVSDTVRKGIIDINSFNGTESIAMIGSFSALGGTSIWLIIASFFRLPVSGTHSVVGATIGYSLVQHGLDGIQWNKFGLIAASWVVSPLMSGIVSSVIFIIIRFFILRKENSFEVGLKFLPLFYAVTLGINLFSIFYKGSHLLGFDKIPLYGVLILTFGGGILCGLGVKFLLVPWLHRRILNEFNESKEPIVQYAANSEIKDKKPDHQLCQKSTDKAETVVCLNESGGEVVLLSINSDSACVENDELPAAVITERPTLGWMETLKQYIFGVKETQEISRKEALQVARGLIADEPKTSKLFSFLQILTASFGAFAHGGNDVSNAIGPLISIWVIYQTGLVVTKVQTPVWILVYGGVGITIGLMVWGRRVIKTMGEDLSPITPTSGFSIEIGSALTVLMASNLGIPISTTHCKVGSVVMVGRTRSKEVVDWKLFRNIIISWIVTIPVSGGMSAAMFAILRQVIT
eukprot:Seg3607.4 transcript_id=Seg3607.4/GoldUCD/mRNA.D3Y31 product="Sodium-dependent phosphate transporter 1" protein_id=Seg3607.4/GoldUCD/D3Y31